MTIKEVFGLNGPIARAGSVLFDILYVNILWIVLGGIALMILSRFLPIPEGSPLLFVMIPLSFVLLMHMGPATAAAYSALGKKQRKEESYTFQDFWKSYKQNYKQGLLIMLALGLAIAVIAYAIWLEAENTALFGKILFVVVPVQGFVLLELLFVSTYIFALLARFEMTTRDLFKYAFMMANKHLLTTILCILLLAGILAASFFLNMGILIFGIGLYVYFSCMLLERVFRNYMPEEEYLTPVEGEVEGEEKNLIPVHDEKYEKERAAILERYTGKKASSADASIETKENSDGESSDL